MRGFVFALLLVAGGLLSALEAEAQDIRFRGETRLKFAVPQGQWNEDNDINPGYGVGLNGQVWLADTFGIYGGWEWIRFKIDDPTLESGIESHATDSGFRAGILTPYMRGLGPIAPYIFVGGLLNRTSFAIGDNREFIGVNSNRELGREFGAGIQIPLRGSILTPSVSYRTYNATFGSPESVGGVNRLTVSNLMIDVGVRFNLDR